PVVASVKITPKRWFVVPLVWLVQVAPAFDVRTIVPKFPTAVPVAAPVKETPIRRLDVPLDWLIQPDWARESLLAMNTATRSKNKLGQCFIVLLLPAIVRSFHLSRRSFLVSVSEGERN